METKRFPSEELVEAVKYNQIICVDVIHDHYTSIEEYFVPSYGIAFNFFNGSLNFFKCTTPRYLIRSGTEHYPEALTELSSSNDPQYKSLLFDIQRRQHLEEVRYQESLRKAQPTSLSIDKNFVLDVVALIEIRDRVEKVAKNFFTQKN